MSDKIKIIPLCVFILPLFFLLFWVPPFFVLTFFEWIDVVFLEDMPFLIYMMLLSSGLLNLGNAICLTKKQKLDNIQAAFFAIRLPSIFMYPALLWGVLWGVFILMGPARNVHILLFILFSLPVINLSGAFYAIPLIRQLRKSQKIGSIATIFYLAFSFIIGLDILTAFLLRKKWKECFLNTKGGQVDA